MANTTTIQEVKDIIEASDCLGKIMILAALEEISKPIDYTKVYLDFNRCEYCGKEQPCDCPMKYEIDC